MKVIFLPVRTIRNTGDRIVPRQKCGHETEPAASLDEWGVGSAVLRLQVADGEKKEGQIEGEEEREERHGRFERADEEDESEDEPALDLLSDVMVDLKDLVNYHKVEP
jgi:hypothetical protein